MRFSKTLPKVSRLLPVIIGLVVFGSLAFASTTFQPVFRPTLEVGKAGGTIKIDGKLNDSGWEAAGFVSNFVERSPGDNTEPDVKTEAFITYDDDNLYVAFVCYDDPAAIRATMCQRDQFNGDDAVCLLVDTYGDASWAYELFVNPYGIQKDLLWSAVGGEDSGFDLIWKSAAQMTDSGYQVEMAVPFASIRFPNKETQSWRVDLWRNRPRESYKQYSWAANDRNEQCWPCQWGTVEGIRDVYAGRGIEILPTVVTYQSGSVSDYGDPALPFENDDLKGELSLGGKYSISSGVTVEAAINPDFSQIEADAAQIDVNSTIALFYPERRPFFQEGSNIFRTLFNSFYSRMINDPQFTVKLTGRAGSNSIGFLSALDENTPYMIPLEERTLVFNSGKSTANVLRASRTFGDNSMLGIFVSDRRFEGGGSGTVAAFDGYLRLSKNYNIIGQFIGTHTKEPDDTSLTARYEGFDFDNGKHTAIFDGESFYGSAFITRLNRDARNWNFFIDYNQVTPTYRTEVGYDPWLDYRNLTFFTCYNIYPQSEVFSRITPQIYSYRRWNFASVKKIEENTAGFEAQMKIAQTHFDASISRRYECWSDIEFKDLWTLNFDMSSRFSNAFGCNFSLNHGHNVARYALVKGKATSLYASVSVKPIDRLVIEPNLSFAQSHTVDTGEELYYGYIARTRIQLQANRQLSFRLVFQYDDFDQAWDIDPLLTYRVSSFSVLYLGSTYDYLNIASVPGADPRWKMASRQFFMKLQYLFQT